MARHPRRLHAADATISLVQADCDGRLVLLPGSLVITGMKTDDKRLMSRIKAGDEKAMAQLLERHWTGLVQYAYGLLGDWARAEDVTQGAYVCLWEKRDRWTEGSSTVLLYRVTRSAALDVLKSPRYVAGPDPLNALIARRTPAGDTALEEAVAKAVEALPHRRREVFRLARERGFSYSEIADVTQQSRRAVASHMSLALSDLRVMLRPFLSRLRRGESSVDSNFRASIEAYEGLSRTRVAGR